MRWATSGRLTPAAATFTSTWPDPGLGVGTSAILRTSGPPGLVMAMAFMAAGMLGIFRLLRAGLSHTIFACRPRLPWPGTAGCDKGKRCRARSKAGACGPAAIGSKLQDGLG